MILVIVGSALSIASFGLGYVEPLTGKPMTITEFYPFFHWRLYGDPKGAEGASTYRLYFRNSASEPWQRHAITDQEGWSRYRFSLHLAKRVRALIQEAESNRSEEISAPLDPTDFPKQHELFMAFITSVFGSVPDGVKVVRESYYPMELLSDSTAYDTTTIAYIVR